MVSREEALALFRCDDLIELGMRADEVRRRLHPGGVVSYTIESGDIAGADLEVHRAAHSRGMRTTATVRFGDGESIEETVDRMEEIRRLQDETGGFAAFVPVKGEMTAVEYLKALAISRIYLDNIPNIEVCRDASGLKACQVGLRFGGNDLGNAGTEEEVRAVIRDAGFIPKQRDALYSTYFLN